MADATKPDATKPTDALLWEKVHKDELDEVEARRKAVHGEGKDKSGDWMSDDNLPDKTKPPQRALQAGLVGVSFSGGGIRSATFCLGILQALGALKLLTRIDYLSTVSGGGYIGGWLAAWIHRAQATDAGAAAEVEKHLDPQTNRCEGDTSSGATEPEPETVHHLREYTRYLSPNLGILSLDTWTLLTIYTRNLFINFLVILPPVLLVVFCCRWLIVVLPQYSDPACRLLFDVPFVTKLLQGFNTPPEYTLRWVLLLVFLLVFGRLHVRLRSGVRHVAHDEELAHREPLKPMSPLARDAGPHGFARQFGLVALTLVVAYLSIWLPLAFFELRVDPLDPAKEPGLFWRGDFFFSDPGSEVKTWWGWAGGYVPAGLLFAFFFGVGAILAKLVSVFWGNPTLDDPRGATFWEHLRYIVGILLNGFVFGAAYTVIVKHVLYYDADVHSVLFTTFGPPLFIFAVLGAGYVEIAVAGSSMGEYEREWRSRAAALMFRLAFGWIVLFGVVAYVPFALRELGSALTSKSDGKEAPWVAAAGWLLTTVVGSLAVRRAGNGGGWLVLIATCVVPLVFLTGLVSICSELSLLIVRADLETPNYLARFRGTDPDNLAWAMLFFAFGTLLAIVFVPTNRFSLHALYMNRLTRCYLGASVRDVPSEKGVQRGPAALSNRLRVPNGFSGFDPRDDLPLAALHSNPKHLPEEPVYDLCLRLARHLARARANPELAKETHVQDWIDAKRALLKPAVNQCVDWYAEGVADLASSDRCIRKAAHLKMQAAEEALLRATENEKMVCACPYFGPYPLFNTTLNLVAGEELAYQDRKGASFVLTPRYCGSIETGFAELPINEDTWNLTVGRAVTISGAALDANMGVHQSPWFTAFLTIVNARLGWWLENPAARGKEWAGKTPDAGAWRYLQELAGYTDAKQRYVHLSDGGHFENTGAYELIRRRCRYVVVIDAAEDPSDASENLANLIQKVRTDFGIPIDLFTSPLQKDEKGISKAHCAIGAIRYDEVDGSGVTGTLVFVRSSMTGDEEADLRNYAATHPPFPHHSTGDQFFDEVQFESYRQLGYHIGESVFREAVKEIAVPEAWNPAERYREFNRQLFAHLRSQWAPRPEADEGARSSWRDYLRATEQLRDTPALHRLTVDLFPELKRLPPVAPAPPAPALPAPRVQLLTDPARTASVTELHAVDHLLQVMELAWIENELERNYANPLNRGWMNVFRRWTTSEMLHRYWPILRGQFSRGFVRFCERALNLDQLPVRWCQLPYTPPVGDDAFVPQPPWADSLCGVFDEFDQEFHREWAVVLSRIGKLTELQQRRYLTRAVKASEMTMDPPLAFAVTTGRGGEQPPDFTRDGWRRHHLPLGLITAFPSATAGEWELLVWIRSPHRTLGLARHSVPTILRDTIVPTLQAYGVPALYVRYPLLGSSLADRIHRTLWEWFFFDLGFVRDSAHANEMKADPTLPRETRLVLRLAAKPHVLQPL